MDFTWGIILAKAKERGPNLLDVITAICWGRKEQNIHSSGITWIAPIATIYSILLHQVNRELNLVQPINTVLLANSQAEIKACERGQIPLIYPANKDKVPLFSFSFIQLNSIAFWPTQHISWLFYITIQNYMNFMSFEKMIFSTQGRWRRIYTD